MKNLIIFSDVHGSVQNLLKLAREIERCDHAIFLGDGINTLEVLDTHLAGKITAIKGNCDLFCPLPNEQLLELYGKKILATHGHQYDVKCSTAKLSKRGKELNADLILYGHTHEFAQIGNLVNVPSLKDGVYVEVTIDKDIKTALKRI